MIPSATSSTRQRTVGDLPLEVVRTVGSVARRLPLALESALALTVASVMVARRPQSKTTRLLGRPRPAGVDAIEVESAPPPSAVRVGRAVERVAAVLPWHPLCLP